LTWSAGAATPVATRVSVDGTLADLAIGAAGQMHVLELARATQRPTLRTFGPSGDAVRAVELDERTASQVRMGPGGPLVLKHPSAQWVPVPAERGVGTAAVTGAIRPGRTAPTGEEIVVLRRENELRAAVVRDGAVLRSWRIRSETPLAEVQLAEPTPRGLLLVLRIYTDVRDEFVALLLGPEGILERVAVDSAAWAETAPLARFRFTGTSLYRLGSTRAGLFVDRFDLEVRR
jgi:hypothetical protein